MLSADPAALAGDGGAPGDQSGLRPSALPADACAQFSLDAMVGSWLRFDKRLCAASQFQWLPSNPETPFTEENRIHGGIVGAFLIPAAVVTSMRKLMKPDERHQFHRGRMGVIFTESAWPWAIAACRSSISPPRAAAAQRRRYRGRGIPTARSTTSRKPCPKPALTPLHTRSDRKSSSRPGNPGAKRCVQRFRGCLRPAQDRNKQTFLNRPRPPGRKLFYAILDDGTLLVVSAVLMQAPGPPTAGRSPRRRRILALGYVGRTRAPSSRREEAPAGRACIRRGQPTPAWLTGRAPTLDCPPSLADATAELTERRLPNHPPRAVSGVPARRTQWAASIPAPW